MSGLCFRLLYCATLDFLFYTLCDIGHFFERWPSTHLFLFLIVNFRICSLAFAYTLILSHQPQIVNTFMLKNAPFSEAFLLISYETPACASFRCIFAPDRAIRPGLSVEMG